MEDKQQPVIKPIIILSGPPGAGKTTIAKHLADILPGPVANIEGDKFWSFFAKDWETIGHRKNFRVLISSATAAAIPYIRAGYHVILDFSVPPWFLPTAHKIVSARGFETDYVVIKPSLQVCTDRAANRPEGQIKDYALFSEFYNDFEKAPGHIVGDDICCASDLAERIRAGLSEGIFRVKL